MFRRGESLAVTSIRAVLVVLLLLIVAAGAVYVFGGTATVPAPFRSETASPTASRSGQALANGSWTTYHADNARTGVDITAKVFGSVGVAWRSGPLDGAIYAEPLVLGDRVIVATENDSVYSISAVDGSVVWRAHLGDPVPSSDLPCGDIGPSGITGTPVIDPDSGTVFVVSFLSPSHHELYALNLKDGGVRFVRPADPPGSDPRIEQQRGALTLANGIVYIPFGGLFGDCGDYHGWVVGARVDGKGDLLSYRVPTGRAGGIWAPGGASVDGAGDLFVATGNSDPTDGFDFGNSVIKLSPGLEVLDYFTPANWGDLNAGDRDVGSTGPALLGPSTVFQIGKEGVGYLINAEKLGGAGNQEFSAPVCGAAFGGTAYSSPLLLVPCADGLTALSVRPGDSPSFQVVWRGPRFDAGPPIVAAGAAWTVDTGEGTIYAFRLGDGSLLFRSSLGSVAHFTTPAAGDGKIFVAANNGITAFSLNP